MARSALAKFVVARLYKSSSDKRALQALKGVRDALRQKNYQRVFSGAKFDKH